MAAANARIIRLLRGILIVMAPVGTVLMLIPDLFRSLQWTSSLYLGIQAAFTAALFAAAAESLSVLRVLAAVGVIALAAETVGVTSGFPFGHYAYAQALQPILPGGVPAAIVCAWMMVVGSSLLLLRAMRPELPRAVLAAAGGVLALAFDLMLEPFATEVNTFWTWQHGVVPWQNYASWFVIGAVCTAAADAFARWKNTDTTGSAGSGALLVLGVNAAQFTLLNVLHGFWLSTGAGLALGAAVIIGLRQRRRR